VTFQKTSKKLQFFIHQCTAYNILHDGCGPPHYRRYKSGPRPQKGWTALPYSLLLHRLVSSGPWLRQTTLSFKSTDSTSICFKFSQLLHLNIGHNLSVGLSTRPCENFYSFNEGLLKSGLQCSCCSM